MGKPTIDYLQHMRLVYLDQKRRADECEVFKLRAFQSRQKAERAGNFSLAAYHKGQFEGFFEAQLSCEGVRDYLEAIPGVAPVAPPRLTLVRDNATGPTPRQTEGNK